MKPLVKWVGALLLIACCTCGIGGFFAYRFFGDLGRELAWLKEAQKAAERATQAPPANQGLMRRIEDGAPLTPENLGQLERICREMAARTEAAWKELDAKPVPPRLVRLKDRVRAAADRLQTSYRELAEGIARRDERSVRATLAGLQSFGDDLKVDVEGELRRLYPQR